jgi:uncharacterized protein YbjT (DUF2867 family)
MNLLILGASGGCGKWTTRLAAERGHHLTTAVRAVTPFDAPTGARIARGDVLEPGFIAELLRGGAFDAVISCVGIRRAHPPNPWSKVVSPIDLTQRLALVLTTAMQQHGPRRLIAISAAGVGDSEPHMSRFNRWLFAHSSVGVSYRDLAEMEKVLGASNLDWLAVRPATLTNGKLTGRARVIDFYGMTSRISRGDVAAWMLDQVESPAPFANRTPMIAS